MTRTFLFESFKDIRETDELIDYVNNYAGVLPKSLHSFTDIRYYKNLIKHGVYDEVMGQYGKIEESYEKSDDKNQFKIDEFNRFVKDNPEVGDILLNCLHARDENIFMDFESQQFKKYINREFWKENYKEIIKTGFDFPLRFIACAEDIFFTHRKKIDALLDEYYTFPQKESDYYPVFKLIEFSGKYPEFRDLIMPRVFDYPNSVSLIFSRPASLWGLRGDPYFWIYLEDIFMDYNIPMDINELEEIIKDEFHKLSGKEIGQSAFIKEFAHGGMSSGCVSGVWLELIPLLKYRLIRLNNDYYLNHGECFKIINDPEKIIETGTLSLDEILDKYDKPFEFIRVHNGELISYE